MPRVERVGGEPTGSQLAVGLLDPEADQELALVPAAVQPMASSRAALAGPGARVLLSVPLREGRRLVGECGHRHRRAKLRSAAGAGGGNWRHRVRGAAARRSAGAEWKCALPGWAGSGAGGLVFSPGPRGMLLGVRPPDSPWARPFALLLVHQASGSAARRRDPISSPLIQGTLDSPLPAWTD